MKNDRKQTDQSTVLSDDAELDALLAEMNDRIANSEVPVAGSEEELSAMLHGRPAPSRIVLPDETEDEEFEELPEKKGGKRFPILNLCLIVLALVLVGGIAYILFGQGNSDPYGGKILENVTAGGINLGGMTVKEAKAALNSALGDVYNTNMHVVMGDQEIVLSAAETGAKLDVDAVVTVAFGIGRYSSAAERLQSYEQTVSNDISLLPYLNLNPEVIREKLKAACGEGSSQVIASTYHLEGTRPALDADNYNANTPCQELILSKGVPGGHPNLDQIYQAIQEAYDQRNFRLVIPAEMLMQYPDPLNLDAIWQELSTPAVEAAEDPATHVVTPGSCGYTFNIEDARAKLAAAADGESVSVPMQYVVPQNLDMNGDFPIVLSSYTAPVYDDDSYRTNLAVLCDAIDGAEIAAGASFSLLENGVRIYTTNGFVNAPVHGNACTTILLGGGSDQFGTQLHIAAYAAGLRIVERHPGDHVCDYTYHDDIDLRGTEIVFREYNDLKIQNTLETPVKIRARMSDGNLTVKILAKTDPGVRYTIVSESVFESNFLTTIIDRDATSTIEYDYVYFEGINGGTFNIRRDATDAAGNVTPGSLQNGNTYQTSLQPANKRVAK